MSNGVVAHVYRGGSMRGTFCPGDRLTVEPVPLTQVRPGDVVAFRISSKRGEPKDLVHRVTSVGPQGLVTREARSLQLISLQP